MTASSRSRWYVVAVLTLVYVLAYADRQILNLLVGPIRHDLGISDTQMSLLMGFSFVVFFTFFGILVGRLADTRSRRALIAAGMLTWSVLTGACGLAQRFWQFLLLRMGVGVGEATLNPSAYSLIADTFPPAERAGALGVYGMGIYIGSGLAYIGGGLIVGWAEGREALLLPFVGSIRPWQAIFLLLGAAGALAVPLLRTIPEPERHELRAAGGVASWNDVVQYLRDHARTFVYFNGGLSLLALAAFASAAWIPSFFIRTYGWSGARPGVVQGIIVLVCGSAGAVVGGRCADRMAQRGATDATLRAALIAALAWLPAGVLYPLMPTGWLAACLLAPAAFFLSWPFAVAPAAIQDITPNEMRGQMSAIYLFVINLIGLGLGPTAVAVLTEQGFKNESALRYAIAVVPVTAILGAVVLLVRALPAYRDSRARVSAQLVVGPADGGGH